MRFLFLALLFSLSCAQQVSLQEQNPEVEANFNAPVQGRILYDGRPITEVTKVEPSFWFRNEDTGKAVEAKVVSEGNRFAVGGLSTGSYGIQVTINANADNSVNMPGDYYSWTPFHVEKNGKAKLEINLSRIFHLLQPVDNSATLSGWEEEGCEPGATVPQDAVFRWEAIGSGTEYMYEIRTIACPYKDLGVVTSAVTSETSFHFTLPSSAADQFYLMTLTGRHENRPVGILMTWGPNFLAWDYRFRVQ